MTPDEKWLLKDKYNGTPDASFEADVLRLRNGEPLAYIIGWIPFCDTKIYLDSHPLIPRPETEYWVRKTIDDIRDLNIHQPKVLDLCAGSGCIGIAVLKTFPEASVDFIEIDQAHHDTIRKNALENNISSDRFRIFGGNLFEQTSDIYDVILTNPPYINPERINAVEKGVMTYEPHQALFGGTDGMELIAEILTKAPSHLSPKGILYIEHEPDQVEAIQKLLPKIQAHEDQYGVLRYSVLRN